MRQLMSFAVAFYLLAFAGSAIACINDREVQNAEREFKSNYLEAPPGQLSPGESGPGDSSGPVAVVAGALSLAGAVTLGIVKTVPRKRES